MLDEVVPYLHARPLNPDEHEIYDQPAVASESGTLFDHCLRALDVSLATGAHGLPLMGTGDWNDGMNLVGAGGKGESVWLGWFLVSLLRPFADIVTQRGDGERADRYRLHASAVTSAIESCVGWRMVSAGVLRRWYAAGVEGEHRMPDRRDRAVMGGVVRRG